MTEIPGNRALVNIVALAIIAIGVSPLKAQDTAITGVLKNPTGEPVVGALVKVRSEELGLGFLVVSQEKGRYNTPNLLPGRYTLQAFGAGYQSAPLAQLDVSKGQQRKMDLVLAAPLKIPPRQKRMTDADYEKLMPEGEGKAVVISWCTTCHTLLPIISARKSRDKWLEAVDRMYNDLLGRDRPLTWTVKYDVFYDLDRPTLMIDYLAKNFGPNTPLAPAIARVSHPNRNLPTTLLDGAQGKYRAMEFSLPAGSMPNDVAVDSKGYAWVSERNTGMIGRFDPNSLSYARIESPRGKSPKVQLNAIAVDPQDHVWYADDGPNARLFEYNPKTKEFRSYPIPDYQYPVSEAGWARIAALRFSDGNVWGTGTTAQRILKLDRGSQKMSEYSVPLGSTPFGLAMGGDKKIWYAAEIGNVVVSLDPTTGRLSPHDVQTPRSDLRGMAADAKGDLWVAATEANKLIKVDSHTGNITEYSIPTEGSGPYSLDIDTKRNLVWFSETFADRLGRFDPAANSFCEFPLPSADSDVQRIEVDRSNPSRIWWSSASDDKIGYIEVTD